MVPNSYPLTNHIRVPISYVLQKQATNHPTLKLWGVNEIVLGKKRRNKYLAGGVAFA
jgi:squalene cyclase